MTPQDRYVVKQIQEWLLEHGSLPECACGCGEWVKFGNDGKPRKYSGRGHRERSEGHRQAVASRNRDRADTIPKEQFYSALDGLRVQKGWTWKQVAGLSGMSYKTFMNVKYDKRRSTVGKVWATDVLKRLAGLGTAPTRHEAGTAGAHVARVDRTISAIGVDPDKRKVYTDSFVDYKSMRSRRLSS